MTRLNDQQQRAATTLDSDVIVDAGAGSGKTRAMTQRFVNATSPHAGMPEWTPVPVDSVVAITFTDKAAGELAERIRLALHAAGSPALARRIDAAFISTIHGFCSRVLREHAVSAGLDPLFGQADNVLAGELSEAAFEQACRLVIQSDPAVGQLFDDYGHDEVRGIVVRIASDLIKKSAEADKIVVEPSTDLRSAARDAIFYFEDAACQLDGCGDTGKTVPQRAGECREFVETVRRLLDEEADAQTFAGELLDAACGIGTKGQTKASGDLLPSIAARAEELKKQAAVALLEAPTKAVVEIVRNYRQAYAAAKRGRGVLDFDDLQLLAARLLGDDEIAQRYRDRFSLVMVDEFQDTDDLQLGIISRVSGDNLFTVGDERQSIYRFRGADVDVYRRHRSRALERGIEPITFSANYRSHADIIAFVNSVFGADEFFGDNLIRLTAEREEPASKLAAGEPRVEFVVVDCHGSGRAMARREEAEQLAERFSALRDAGYEPGEMVVLTRTWGHVDVYADALRSRGFDVRVGGGSFFELPEVTLMTMLARAIANPHDEEAIVTVLASPLVGFTADGLWRLSRRNGEDRSAGVWAALQNHSALSDNDAARADSVVEAIERANRDQLTAPLRTVLLRALEDLDYDLVLFSEGPSGEQELGNILKLGNMADSFEASGGSGMAGFVSYLATRQRLAGNESAATLGDDGSPAVRIMTMHGSKGLEFPVVAVVDLSKDDVRLSDTFQSGWNGGRLEIALKLRRDGCNYESERYLDLKERDRVAQSEEAKRLLYVAATRAEDVLILSGTIDHSKFAESNASLATMAHALGIFDVVAGESGVIEITDDRDARPATFVIRVTGVEEPTTEDEARSGFRTDDTGVGPERRGETKPAPASEFEIPSPLSYSALSVYHECPYRFWVQRVLRAGTLDGVSDDAADALGFGSAVHAALQLSVDAGQIAGPERIEAIAAQHGLDAGQVTELRDAVANFMSSDIRAALVEWGSVASEVPFTIPVGSGGDSFLLGGAIDLLARRGGLCKVVDYKTGVSGSAEDLVERYSVQARCYAYALLASGATEVEVTIVRPQVISAGRLERVTFGPFTGEDAAAIAEELLSVHRSMLRREFSARPDRERCWECPVGPVLCKEAYGAD